MRPFPHTLDPDQIDIRRRYTITDAAKLLGCGRTVLKDAAATGELRTDYNPKWGKMHLIKGSNLRLFYLNRAGMFFIDATDKRFKPRSDARPQSY